MSLLAITVQPVADATHFRSAVQLDGARYQFRFYTSAIDGGWCFDVSNDDETSQLNGVGIVAGVDLLHPYRHLDVPPGQLFTVDSSGGDPDESAFFERRASLYYLEASA